jgi:hypothetical protein
VKKKDQFEIDKPLAFRRDLTSRTASKPVLGIAHEFQT